MIHGRLGRLAVGLVAAGMGAGCFAPPPDVQDPGSSAPELAGRWCIWGDEQGFVGFLTFDENGDPERLVDNPLAADALGEDTLLLDGAVQGTNSGLQYRAIAKATLDGADIDFVVELEVFSYGYQAGALALKFEGERTTAARLDGIAVILQDFPGQDAPGMRIETARGTLDTCD